MKIKNKTLAQAFWETIKDQSLSTVTTILHDLLLFYTMYTTHEDTHDFLDHPTISEERKKAIIHTFIAVQKSKKEVESFLCFLLNNRQLSSIVDVLVLLEQYRDEHFKLMTVQVKTVSSLTEHQKKEIQEKLKKRFRVKDVHIEEVSDPSILGGIVVSFQGQVIDASMKRKLSKLREILHT